MASSGKKKTTMAKLNREAKMRERRLDKQARKDARKRAAALEAEGPAETQFDENGEPIEPVEPVDEQAAEDAALASRADA